MYRHGFFAVRKPVSYLYGFLLLYVDQLASYIIFVWSRQFNKWLLPLVDCLEEQFVHHLCYGHAGDIRRTTKYSVANTDLFLFVLQSLLARVACEVLAPNWWLPELDLGSFIAYIDGFVTMLDFSVGACLLH